MEGKETRYAGQIPKLDLDSGSEAGMTTTKAERVDGERILIDCILDGDKCG